MLETRWRHWPVYRSNLTCTAPNRRGPKLAQRWPTWLGHHFQGHRVKGQGRPLYLPPCWRVRQLQWWPWETAATLPSARPRDALRRPRREERGGGISWRPPAYSVFSIVLMCFVYSRN